MLAKAAKKKDAAAAAAKAKADAAAAAVSAKAAETRDAAAQAATAKKDEVAQAARDKAEELEGRAKAAAKEKKDAVAAAATAKKDEVTQAARDKAEELEGRAKAKVAETRDEVKAAVNEKTDAIGAAAAAKKEELSEAAAAASAAAAEKATAAKEALKEEALDSSEIEPTVVRRNVLLTVHEGDVDAALGAVGKQYLLTGKLSKAAAASVPLVGLAYSTIGPLWDKMRDTCVIAAIYGHDIEDDEVQGRIFQCVGEMMFEKGEGGGTPAIVKSVGKKITARISQRSASSAAINSTPLLGAAVNVVIQKTIATELREVQSTAIITFKDGGRELTQEEYLIEDSEMLQAGKMRYISDKLNGLEDFTDEKTSSAKEALDARYNVSARAEAAKQKAFGKLSLMDNRFGVTKRVNEAKVRATDKVDEVQTLARTKAAEKASSVVNGKLDMVTMVVVEGLDNSLDLPGFLAVPLETMVRETVEDVKHETTAGIESFIVKEEEWEPTIKVEDLSCWGRMRGWILYHWCPYDHAIGYQMVDPVYVTIKLLALIPFFGTQALIYGFLFILHDKSDDYQMVKFILDFKGMQALTLGIAGTLVGGYRYAYCANHHPPDCQITGPGAGRFFYTSILGWLGCALLVWAAFAELTCKKCRQGGDRFSGGGRLSHWILYDMLCMTVAVGVVVYAVTTADLLEGTSLGAEDLAMAINRKQTPDGSDYRFRQFAYWSKVLYGLLSLPFIIFMVPAIDVMFTHASPTGYTLAGEVAPKRVNKTEKETHDEVAEAIEDTAIEDLLKEMLQLAIHGGPLPIEDWSKKLAPTMKGVTESLANSREHIKSKAEEARAADGGRLGMITGAASGLKDEAQEKAIDQIKVTVASATHLIAKQVVYNLNTSLELPTFLAQSVEKFLVSIVPDIQVELNEGIDEYFNKKLNGDPIPEEEEPLGCCGKIRAYMLYHYLPYDHGLGWLFADPLWLTLKALSLIPLLGSEFVVYFFYFFMIEKSDEYQLTRYILDLKGLAVLSMGIAHAAFGAMGYFDCINTFYEPDELKYVYKAFHLNGSQSILTPTRHTNGTMANTTCTTGCLETCSETENERLHVAESANSPNCTDTELTCLTCSTMDGGLVWKLTDVVEPGDDCATSAAARFVLFWWVIAAWVGTALLVWAAYIMLIRLKERELKEEESSGDGDGKLKKKKERKTIEDAKLHRAYGQLSRVKSLFAYDVGCMLLLGLVALYFFLVDNLSDWEIRQVLYWSKCTYGLLSLPCEYTHVQHSTAIASAVVPCHATPQHSE
jgi:hypothetical protein